MKQQQLLKQKKTFWYPNVVITFTIYIALWRRQENTRTTKIEKMVMEKVYRNQVVFNQSKSALNSWNDENNGFFPNLLSWWHGGEAACQLSKLLWNTLEGRGFWEDWMCIQIVRKKNQTWWKFISFILAACNFHYVLFSA